MFRGKKMNYIIFDLEFNQAYDFTEEKKNLINPNCPFEIIQIGAVKLNENFQIISTLDRLIKPELYTDIHPFVKELTGITIEKLSDAKPFKEICKEFIEFIGHESILCVWGMCDIKELFRNIKYHNLDTSLIPKKYIDIQLYTSKYLDYPKGRHVGLGNAVELLNIPIGNQFHDAFNDAYYTVEIFKKIYDEEIEPKIYNLNEYLKLNRHNNVKRKLDSCKLIKQFEKMFYREMTVEEQSIIKLAYIMGKTHQFQIEIHDNSKN